MITLYGFGRVDSRAIGETRDLRAQWALEETGLPYRVHPLDHTGGEMDDEAFGRISSFRQLPVIDDDGFIVAESGAVLLYLADRSGKLIPPDFKGRIRVIQWCFAALATVERPMTEILTIDKFGGGDGAEQRRAEMVKAAGRWLAGLERRLDGHEWIVGADFTVADILLATVLRQIRKTELMEPWPRVREYHARALARPAWQRTLLSYADRLGVSVAEIE